MTHKKRLPVSLLLLAGGRGRRMGGNKLYLTHEFSFLVENLLVRMSPLFSDIVLCIGSKEGETVKKLMSPLLEKYQIKLAEDRAAERGPLEGLHQGLNTMESEWGFLFGCDMPTPQEAVIRQIWSQTPPEAQVSAVRLDGYVMALHAFYRKDCTPTIDTAITQGMKEKRGGARIISFYDQIKLHVVDEKSLAILPGYKKSFANFNTPEELRKVIEG